MSQGTLWGITMVGVSVMIGGGCATVPTVVPQALIDARAALGVAKKINAEVLVPDEYKEAQKQLDRTEAAFSAEQRITTVEALAFEATAYAEIAEAHARVRILEQEYESLQQAMITQQNMLNILTRKEAVVKKAIQMMKQSEADKQAAEIKAVEEARKAEEEARRRAEAEREAEMLRKAKKIRDAEVRMEARGLVINLSGKVLFDTGSSKLQPGALTALEQVKDVLKEYPEYRVRIEGHTDSTGDELTNNTLSQARAESVLNFLQQKGVPFDSLTAVGMGAKSPVANNNTAAGRQLNRRVEIILEKKTETPKDQ
ncbi:DUF4398 and OmpA-like domain-containing protein [candidate division FCPU426 bacterium]|nr:DUF4398 and OmpA-like domain-containing protein [candidate division FCPU426 bacterium]